MPHNLPQQRTETSALPIYKIQRLTIKRFEFVGKPNASLRGKNTFAKMVEGRKQQTYFCPALMTCYVLKLTNLYFEVLRDNHQCLQMFYPQDPSNHCKTQQC